MNVVAPCVTRDNLPYSSKTEQAGVGRSLLRQKNSFVVSRQKCTQQGFTLVELIMVIVLLGVMAVGISGFIGLSTQTYINVAQRDELVASARFAIERLNREVRNAVPNSVRINSNSSTQCLEFLPIVASTDYVDIAVAPEPASDTLTVIPFVNHNNNAYILNSGDIAIVYPLYSSEIYGDLTNHIGKVFGISSINTTAVPWIITLDHVVVGGVGNLFAQDSPNKRLYIANTPVSYCVNNGKLIRYDNYNIVANSYVEPSNASPALMAENLAAVSSSAPIFTIQPATLKRNAQVQIKLGFTQNDEHVIFANDIHLVNVP